jgi:hypothetical protein
MMSFRSYTSYNEPWIEQTISGVPGDNNTSLLANAFEAVPNIVNDAFDAACDLLYFLLLAFISNSPLRNR